MRIRKRSEFPKCVRGFKELKGICIGECIGNQGFKTGVAHAHCHGQHNIGWICLEFKYQLKEKLTLLHEVAHLLINKKSWIPSHGKKWREKLVDIGGTYKSYPCYTKSFNYKDYSPKSEKK